MIVLLNPSSLPYFFIALVMYGVWVFRLNVLSQVDEPGFFSASSLLTAFDRSPQQLNVV